MECQWSVGRELPTEHAPSVYYSQIRCTVNDQVVSYHTFNVRLAPAPLKASHTNTYLLTFEEPKRRSQSHCIQPKKLGEGQTCQIPDRNIPQGFVWPICQMTVSSEIYWKWTPSLLIHIGFRTDVLGVSDAVDQVGERASSSSTASHFKCKGQYFPIYEYRFSISLCFFFFFTRKTNRPKVKSKELRSMMGELSTEVLLMCYSGRHFNRIYRQIIPRWKTYHWSSTEQMLAEGNHCDVTLPGNSWIGKARNST